MEDNWLEEDPDEGAPSGYETDQVLIGVQEPMLDSAETLGEKVIGERIVAAYREPDPEQAEWGVHRDMLVIELSNGMKVRVKDTDDCCAFTAVEAFWRNPESVDHIITSVFTTDGYTRWFIYADLTAIMRLQVGWSEGNYPYYGYGFNIEVVE